MILKNGSKVKEFQTLREEIIKNTGNSSQIRQSHDAGIQNSVNTAVSTGLITEEELNRRADEMKKTDEEAEKANE